MFKHLSNYAKLMKQDKEGQGLVEYALILVLVAVVVVIILSQLGPSIGNIFSTVVVALNGEGNAVAGDICLGDVAPPTEYYLFAGGNTTINSPATYYTDSGCTSVGGTVPITVIHPSVSKPDADQICQDRHGSNANVNAPGDIWYCS